jgi:predicted DNA-binding WGR domain protein
MRRFEFQEGASHKFWEVSVGEDELTVRFGKVGTQGQTKTKSFESLDAVLEAAEKLIAEKLSKGYVEVTATAPGRSPKPARPSSRASSAPATRVRLRDASGQQLVLTLGGKRVIEGEGEHQEVHSFPSATAAKEHFERLVFLRGKRGFVTVETTQVPAERFEAELELVIENFEGTLESREGRCTITFQGDDTVPLSVCKGLVKRLVREAPRCVQLVCANASPAFDWSRALQGTTLPSVKAFIFDTYFETQTRQGQNSVGDLEAVLTACPHLERLFATGDLALSPTRHESLRELYLLGDPLSRDLLEGLGGCKFPRLERLAISLASDAGPIDGRPLLQALRTLRAPVREVHLEGVARRGLPEDLEVGGSLVRTDDALEHRERFLPAVYNVW